MGVLEEGGPALLEGYPLHGLSWEQVKKLKGPNLVGLGMGPGPAPGALLILLLCFVAATHLSCSNDHRKLFDMPEMTAVSVLFCTCQMVPAELGSKNVFSGARVCILALKLGVYWPVHLFLCSPCCTCVKAFSPRTHKLPCCSHSSSLTCQRLRSTIAQLIDTLLSHR